MVEPIAAERRRLDQPARPHAALEYGAISEPRRSGKTGQSTAEHNDIPTFADHDYEHAPAGACRQPRESD